jgi:glyoxylase-like metal-dependent hydrolase (beta-lactamase superfamily II)
LQVGELAPGLWWWTARHPDWRPGLGWDAEVRCFYVEADDATLVVDPLVPEDEAGRFWAALDRDVERRGVPVAVLLTQAAHARSAEEVARRYGASVWGHEGAREKVRGAVFQTIRHGDELPGGASVLRWDEPPGGSGTPVYLPSHRAIAVGDLFIAVDGELRVWWPRESEEEKRWYHERLLPSLRGWAEIPVERLLIAHGEQLSGGGEELAAALDRPPYEVD